MENPYLIQVIQNTNFTLSDKYLYKPYTNVAKPIETICFKDYDDKEFQVEIDQQSLDNSLVEEFGPIEGNKITKEIVFEKTNVLFSKVYYGIYKDKVYLKIYPIDKRKTKRDY